MTNNIRWGLDNPHPFSQMKTELIWERKYDEYGSRGNGVAVEPILVVPERRWERVKHTAAKRLVSTVTTRGDIGL